MACISFIQMNGDKQNKLDQDLKYIYKRRAKEKKKKRDRERERDQQKCV